MVHQISQKHQYELYSLLGLSLDSRPEDERFVARAVLYLMGATFEDTSPPIGHTEGCTEERLHGLPWRMQSQQVALVAVYPLDETPEYHLSLSRMWQYWTFVIIGFLLEKYPNQVNRSHVGKLQAVLHKLDAPVEPPY